MNITRTKGFITWSAAIIATLAIAYTLTARYFPVEPDVANSPLVWRGFLTEGFAVFKDWKPTPDNWYFTIYPVNFLLFALLSDDGKLPLIISTSIYISLTAIIIGWMIYTIKRSGIAFLATLCLILLPAYSYTFGFLAHPFSHNSTNFFGVVIVGLSLWNLKRNSLLFAIFYSILALLPAVSDPWFLASYFLPLLLTHIYFSWKGVLQKNITLVFALAFILAMTHVIPRALGLPVQHLHILPFNQWVTNTGWVVVLLGKSMNLFFIDNPKAHIASFILWTFVLAYAALITFKGGKEARFIAIFGTLTIAGIISSFIISYDAPDYISARFFMNAVLFTLTLAFISFSLRKNHIITVIIVLFAASSLYSYQVNQAPLYDQEAQTRAYIGFLKEHNLTFGYGDYWKASNTVNWLSEGKIHITPIFFDKKTYRIQFDNVRSQTLASWLTPEYLKNTPSRQFVAIPAVKSAEATPDVNQRLEAIAQQVGLPDQTLIFQGMTFYIYDRKIALN